MYLVRVRAQVGPSHLPSTTAVWGTAGFWTHLRQSSTTRISTNVSALCFSLASYHIFLNVQGQTSLPSSVTFPINVLAWGQDKENVFIFLLLMHHYQWDWLAWICFGIGFSRWSPAEDPWHPGRIQKQVTGGWALKAGGFGSPGGCNEGRVREEVSSFWLTEEEEEEAGKEKVTERSCDTLFCSGRSVEGTTTLPFAKT